jgi:DNA modification methylase
VSVRILLGDVREKLAELPDESVHCVVTSPPYFGLRDYGVAGQIGLEPTPAEFVAVMVDVFREVRRVLRSDGVLWLNLGDSYAGGGTVGRNDAGRDIGGGGNKLGSGNPGPQGTRQPVFGLKPKDLIGIPWRVAFALQADGWYLRQDIIWSKPNPMPESVTDRCTKAHEYLFLLSKSARYHYDAEAISEEGSGRTPGNRNYKYDGVPGHETKQGILAQADVPQLTRNRRSVWEVATQPFKEAHFATFPPDLIEPCIKAGCPKVCCAKCGAPVVRETERVDQGFDGSRYGERAVAASGGAITGGTAKSTLGSSNGKLVGKTETTGWLPSCTCDAGLARGTVLDPFGGAGTTGLVADRLQRDAILIELNPEYAGIAERRIQGDAPMFAQVNA